MDSSDFQDTLELICDESKIEENSGDVTKVWENVDKTLFTFLLGTVDTKSPISKLRGQNDLLKIIFVKVCEEFWGSHIIKMDEPLEVYTTRGNILSIKFSGIPRLPEFIQVSQQIPKDYQELERQYLGGLPAATLEENVEFPKPLKVTIDENCSSNKASFFQKDSIDSKLGHLYVNMLPFNLKDKKTLPDEVSQYWDIIKKCIKRLQFGKKGDQEIAYLTVDERPAIAGSSQRRGGVHCESPSILPIIESIDNNSCNNDYLNTSSKFAIKEKNGMYLPGAEHHWGRGHIFRHDCIVGGIFMCSNVDKSTAVWNHYINDTKGEVIGPHGDLEHVRSQLGQPSKLLSKGELVWMTDKTPHESSPVAFDCNRQYFRLVCGKVSAWFTSHSTANPRFNVPPNVRIVNGSKFKLNVGKFTRRWMSGSKKEVKRLNEERELYEVLQMFGMNHLAERWISNGVNNVYKLYHLLRYVRQNWQSRRNKPHDYKLSMAEVQHGEDSILEALSGYGWNYFELTRFRDLREFLEKRFKERNYMYENDFLRLTELKEQKEIHRRKKLLAEQAKEDEEGLVNEKFKNLFSSREDDY